MIELKNVTKEYTKGNAALNGVSVKIERGEFVFIVGDSGSGKSTLIRLIMKELDPTNGTIIVNGQNLNRMKHRNIAKYRRGLGVVFQDFRLLKDRNIYENIAFALRVTETPTRVIKRKVPAALSLVGLAQKYKSYPKELSGGEQQRVAIARALANNPDILLCDEATSALDIENTEEIVELLREINEKTHITIVFITHEMDVAKKLFDRIAFMEDGKLKEVTDIYSAFANPKSDIAKSLVQRVLNVEVPEGLKAKTNEEILRLSYTGDDSYDPVISVASKNYDITMDIINGKVDYIRNKPFGMLIVILRGEDAERKKALEYISKNVYKLERLGGR